MEKIIGLFLGFILILACKEIQGNEKPDNPTGSLMDSSALLADTVEAPLPPVNSDSVYHVPRADLPIPINGDWDKKEWSGVEAGEITHFTWVDPKFKPVTQMKMAYDDDNFYVIFKVRDQYVRALATEINGDVWEDGAVELFFAPDTLKTLQYFNLEINCIGTPLMFYIRKPMSDYTKLIEKDIRKIQIASTLEGPIDDEITEPVTWIIEYKVPLAMIEYYARVSRPAPGVTWRANFFKIATNSSNEHYVTWSPVISENPHFHKPEFFGELKFVD